MNLKEIFQEKAMSLKRQSGVPSVIVTTKNKNKTMDASGSASEESDGRNKIIFDYGNNKNHSTMICDFGVKSSDNEEADSTVVDDDESNNHQSLSGGAEHEEEKTIEISYHEYLVLKYQSHQFAYIFAKQQEQLHELKKLEDKNYILKKNNKLLKKRLRKRGKSKRRNRSGDADVDVNAEVNPDTEEREKQENNERDEEDEKQVDEDPEDPDHDDYDDGNELPPITAPSREDELHDASTVARVSTMTPHFVKEINFIQKKFAEQAQFSSSTLTRSQSHPCITSTVSVSNNHSTKDDDEEEDLNEGESRAALINLVIGLTVDLAKVRSQCDQKDLCISKLHEEVEDLLVQQSANEIERGRYLRGQSEEYEDSTSSDKIKPSSVIKSPKSFVNKALNQRALKIQEGKEKLLEKANDLTTAASNKKSFIQRKFVTKDSCVTEKCHSDNNLVVKFPALGDDQKSIMLRKNKRFSSFF